MPEGSIHVQAVFRTGVQHEGGGNVDGQPDGANDQHEPAVNVDFMVVQHAFDCFPNDPARDGPQAECIKGGGQYFGSLVTESSLNGLRSPSDPHRHQCQCNGSGVGQHVSGIGEQCQAAGKNPAENFGDHEAGDQNQGDKQAAATGLPQFCSVVVVAVFVVAVFGVVVVGVVVAGVVVVVVVVVVVMIVTVGPRSETPGQAVENVGQ